MSLNELCEKYNLTESTVLTNFTRTQKSLLKKYGVVVKKVGRGKAAYYEEEHTEIISDRRALTMFDETHSDIMLNKDSLTLINADFLIFLGVVSTPMAMFRGTPQDFLRYIGVKINSENLEMLEDTLLNLVDRELICYDVDEDVIIYHYDQDTKEFDIDSVYHIGTISKKTIQAIVDVAKWNSKIVIVDAQRNLENYKGVTSLTPNLPDTQKHVGYYLNKKETKNGILKGEY